MQFSSPSVSVVYKGDTVSGAEDQIRKAGKGLRGGIFISGGVFLDYQGKPQRSMGPSGHRSPFKPSTMVRLGQIFFPSF